MLRHSEINQLFVDEIKAKTYLEIGYERGGTWLRIACHTKYAVDPRPHNKAYWKHKLHHIGQRKTRFFCMTSDEFFSGSHNLLTKKPLDVVYIDGLHTFEQSLRDFLNSMEYLSKGGVILLDDCNPVSDTIATPGVSIEDAKRIVDSGYAAGKLSHQWDGRWCGDVWKTVDYLRGNCPSINVSVLDTDTGLGVVSVKKNQKFVKPTASITPYKALSYQHLENNRKSLLNLQPIQNLDAVINLHCR